MYGEKYFHSYCDAFGVQCRISILEEDYVGVASEIEGQPIPIVINYESDSDFKYDPIRSSSAEVFLTFGTGNGIDFEEFWTADERKFKVEHYISAQLDWVGYVIPNGFGYQLKGGVYYASIEANDGLATLEGYDFLYDATGEPYGTQDLTFNNGFEFPFILIATEILNKLDLGLSTWTCVDVYERSMTKIGDTRDADPLATSYVNVKTYINETEREDIPYWKDAGEVFNCREVLENLCYLFGAKIYQSDGTWRIKRVNADVDYGSGDTQRYWRKYNTAAVYLGRETINQDVTVLCDTIENAMIGTDHVMRMDSVYKAFRMNYKYTFVRQGDTPVNFLTNGDFSDFLNTSNLAAPTGWERWSEPGKFPPRLQGVTIDPDDAEGYTTGIEFGTQKTGINATGTDPYAAIWAALKFGSEIEVKRGDQLFFEFWQKIKKFSDNLEVQYFGIVQIRLEAADATYYLENTGFPGFSSGGGKLYYPLKTDWKKDNDKFLWASANLDSSIYDTQKTTYAWEKVIYDVPEMPADGKLFVQFHGLAASKGRDSDSFPKFDVSSATQSIPGFLGTQITYNIDDLKVVRKDFIDEGGDIPRLQLTGVQLSYIPEESDLPQQQDFVYENNTGRYTLEPEPIEVYNGDVQNEKHISNIIVPTNVTGLKNFWDTIDDEFGGSSLGLTTVRSIMQQYFSPNRIIEGTIKLDNLTFDTRYEFEFLPGKKFILQRGGFNRKKGYLEDAMFVQISQEELPSGGTEGGDTTGVHYVFTGNTRCVKDGSGLNTGRLEGLYIDSNINSETFGQTQWILGPEDLGACPIGEPNDYYWGSDVAGYDLNNFVDFPYYVDDDFPNEVQVPFNNDGTGKYLYFLHRSSLGLVTGIETVPQPEIISDWNYLSDETIDGYTYKVLRMNYITAEYYNYNIIFKFT